MVYKALINYTLVLLDLIISLAGNKFSSFKRAIVIYLQLLWTCYKTTF